MRRLLVDLSIARTNSTGSRENWITNDAKPGISALDLGSGPGFFTIRMSEQIGSNGVVYASYIINFIMNGIMTVYGTMHLHRRKKTATPYTIP